MEDLTIFDGGKVRRLGCFPRVSQVGDWPCVGQPDAPQLISRESWGRYAGKRLDQFAWMVKDQGSQNSCTAASTQGAVMLAREFAGLDRVELSQAVPYGLGNGGRDRGMAIDTALRIMQDTGTVPVKIVKQYDWKGYSRRTWPENWRETAKSYRILEAWDCPTHEHLVSAVFRGFPVVFGVYWSLGGGHAIVATGWENGKTRILNSWGEDWGEGGFGWLPDSQCERGIESFGGWALRVVTDPTNDGQL